MSWRFGVMELPASLFLWQRDHDPHRGAAARACLPQGWYHTHITTHTYTWPCDTSCCVTCYCYSFSGWMVVTLLSISEGLPWKRGSFLNLSASGPTAQTVSAHLSSASLHRWAPSHPHMDYRSQWIITERKLAMKGKNLLLIRNAILRKGTEKMHHMKGNTSCSRELFFGRIWVLMILNRYLPSSLKQKWIVDHPINMSML